jgi:hypothetical protein
MLAVRLASLMADCLEAQRPSVQRVARAKMEGACEALHELGYGETPAEIYMMVMNWLRAWPRPREGMAYSGERKAWVEKVGTDLAPRVEALRHGG